VAQFPDFGFDQAVPKRSGAETTVKEADVRFVSIDRIFQFHISLAFKLFGYSFGGWRG